MRGVAALVYLRMATIERQRGENKLLPRFVLTVSRGKWRKGDGVEDYSHPGEVL